MRKAGTEIRPSLLRRRSRSQDLGQPRRRRHVRRRGHHPRVERFSIVPVSLSIRAAWLASEKGGQKVSGTGWSADIERRAIAVIGDGATAVLEEIVVTGERAGNLIAHRVLLGGDRTGADYLVFRQGHQPIGARK